MNESMSAENRTKLDRRNHVLLLRMGMGSDVHRGETMDMATEAATDFQEAGMDMVDGVVIEDIRSISINTSMIMSMKKSIGIRMTTRTGVRP